MKFSVELNKKAESILKGAETLEMIKEPVSLPERRLPEPCFSEKLLRYWQLCLAEESLVGLAKQKADAGVKVSQEDIEQGVIASSKDTVRLFSLWCKKRGKKLNVTLDLLQDKEWADKNKIPASIPIMIAPTIFSKRDQWGRKKKDVEILTPLWVSASLGTDQKVIPPGEDCLSTWIPRDFLAPNEDSPFVLGDGEVLEEFQADNPFPYNGSWSDILDYCRQMWAKAYGKNWRTKINAKGYQEIEGQAFVLAEDSIFNASGHVLATYRKAAPKVKGEKNLSLLARLASMEPMAKGPLKEQWERSLISKRHLGHVTSLFPLSASQREAMVHFLDMKPSEVLAVNGPPGTGKTTLLQGVVASMSVQAALREGTPPVVMGASSLNQAVTNIIDAFNEISGVQRWLPEVPNDGDTCPVAFGTYLVSQKKIADNKSLAKKYQWMTRDNHDFAKRVEDPEYVSSAKGYFLDRASDYFGANILDLEGAKTLLLQKMRSMQSFLEEGIFLLMELHQAMSVGELVESSGGLESLESYMTALCSKGDRLYSTAEKMKQVAWLQHHNTEPVWMSLMGWLPPIKKRRQYRNELFWHQESASWRQMVNEEPFVNCPDQFVPHGFNREDVEDYLALLFNDLSKKKKAWDGAKEKVLDKQQEIEGCQARWQKWCTTHAPQQTTWAQKLTLEEVESALVDFEDKQGETNPDNIFNWLDTHLRAELFELATHYWEARWLLEMENCKALPENPSRALVEAQWRRYAMLTPVFVSTLQSGPSFFTVESSNGYRAPLFGFGDLLIIDEGGQVTPPVAGGMFAMAQKALVVGDTSQIEPIRNIPASIDRGNLKKMKLITNDDEYQKLAEKGILASSGTLMHMAQNNGAYQAKGEGYPQGMFLREHRRCLPEIIAYCNDLAYHGALTPKRPTAERPWPAMGYAFVKGRSEKSDGSRRNVVEAQVIAQWVSDNQEALAEYYGKSVEDLHEVIGIVTPFWAQRVELQQALQKVGIKAGGESEKAVRVGTVHVFQGAECPVILFSPVYTTEDTGAYFFDNGVNMLNVAVSRAKDSFLTFGDIEIFDESQADKPSGLLAKYLFSDSTNEISGIDHVPEVAMKESCSTLEAHQEVLREAFVRARKKLTIVSAYIRERAVEHDRIDDMVREATDRGVEVTIYVDRDSNSTPQKTLTDSAQKAVSLLEDAGAQVIVVHRTHRKHLCVDDQIYTNGSFNWLSAEREISQYMKDEKTDVVTGEAAQKRIVEVQAMMDALLKPNAIRAAS